MVNFARFIPGTPDADFMRQQVSERGVLEKIDAVNEVIKRGLGEDKSISDFYKMIADIEDNLNRNMNDPRAKRMANTFVDTHKEEKPAAPKVAAPKVEEKADTKPETVNDNKETAKDPDAVVDENPVIPAENEPDGGQGAEGIGTVVEETADGQGINEPANDEGEQGEQGTGDAGDDTNAETENTTRRGRKKSEDAE
jgi:hypothetical protein